VNANIAPGRPLAILTRTWPKLSETFVMGEILGLERRGYDLRIYALAAPQDAESPRVARGVQAPVAYPPSRGLRAGLQVVAAHGACLLAAPLRWVSTLVRVLRRGETGRARDFLHAGWLAARLRRDGVAHVHAHFASEPAGVAELASRMTGIPYSISAHAKDIWLSEASGLQRKLASAAFTVTCTEHNRVHLAALAPQAKVTRMYHGVDTERLQPPAARAPATGRRPLILSVGRLRAKKGLHTLIEACALLRTAGVDHRVQIVGYGPERAALAAAIARYRLDDTVELTGKLDHEEVIRRYADADLFVLPCTIVADGDRDGIPNVLLEAMAMGLPVVSTFVSGIPELVEHERNGLLVAPEDATALATAMRRLLDDDDLRARLAAAARATVTAHFTDRNLDTLCRLLPRPTCPALPQGAEAMHACRG
jgi:glycosyltransferase involved in cell wall biosynthesis